MANLPAIPGARKKGVVLLNSKDDFKKLDEYLINDIRGTRLWRAHEYYVHLLIVLIKKKYHNEIYSWQRRKKLGVFSYKGYTLYFINDRDLKLVSNEEILNITLED